MLQPAGKPDHIKEKVALCHHFVAHFKAHNLSEDQAAVVDYLVRLASSLPCTVSQPDSV